MDLTSTAQAAQNVAQALGTLLNTPWTGVMQYLALGLVGIILIPTVKQHLIELLISKLNPPALVKMLLPTAFASVSGMIVKALGADVPTALAATGIWATMTHLVNESPLALTLQTKAPAIAADLNKAESALNGAKITGLLLAFLLLGSMAHAQTGMSLSGTFGSAALDIQSDGSWVGNGSTIGGGELNYGWGSTDAAGNFQPLVIALVGLAGEHQQTKDYADVLAGVGLSIPGSMANIPLTIAADWRLFAGKRYPAIMVGTSIQFGKAFWVSK